MEKTDILQKGKKIHFIGVGGIGMSALAFYCLGIGVKVSGSDACENDITRRLASRGAKIHIGHRRLNARGADAVVYSSAISGDNAELIFARDNGKLVLKRSELLALIEKRHRFSIAVSGCHGKTTTTAMIAHIFAAAGEDPTAFIGGEDREFGNFRMGGEEIFITEACEYKRNFLELSPSLAVVLNVDDDHLDCYGNFGELLGAYKKFVSRCVAVINADDAHAPRVAAQSAVTYGIENIAVYMAKNVTETDGGFVFDFCEYGNVTAKITLGIGGRYNVYNALAALACARYCGVGVGIAAASLKEFKGVLRRREFLGTVSGSQIIADYAHHPREIAAVLGKEEKCLVVFQPHTYSRTRILMDEFVTVLSRYHCVILPSYAAREEYEVEGSAYSLYLNLVKAGAAVRYAETEEILFSLLAGRDYEKIFFLGAGDIYSIAEKYAAKGR